MTDTSTTRCSARLQRNYNTGSSCDGTKSIHLVTVSVNRCNAVTVCSWWIKIEWRQTRVSALFVLQCFDLVGWVTQRTSQPVLKPIPDGLKEENPGNQFTWKTTVIREVVHKSKDMTTRGHANHFLRLLSISFWDVLWKMACVESNRFCIWCWKYSSLPVDTKCTVSCITILHLSWTCTTNRDKHQAQ